MGKVHTVGHSLGAHVAGGARAYLKSAHPGEPLGRITEMYPAGPSFHHFPASGRLDPGDAKFVDVIHINMGDLNLLNGGVSFGTPKRSGHADFYPNRGEQQLDCWKFESVGNLFGTCSHSMSVKYFAKSIKHPKKYKACVCKSWAKFEKNSKCKKACKNEYVIMGEHCPLGSSGQFYLNTYGT